MSEPVILGDSISQLFLYFIWYSFLGWCMETVYCSLKEKHYVPRGFLYGPICPIYGVGVLLMILFFKPLSGNPLVFYVTAVVVMSAWEYLVAWFLETTTHIKYWDYSDTKFNLHGRITLWVSLVWGALAYIIIFWVHPQVAQTWSFIPLGMCYYLCGVCSSLLVTDAVLTIRQLALVSRLMKSVMVAGEELQLQLSLGKAELTDKLSEKAEDLQSARAQLGDKLDQKTEGLRVRYNEQLSRLERQSRRFRRHYVHYSLPGRYAPRMADIRAAGERAVEELRRYSDERRREKALKGRH